MSRWDLPMLLVRISILVVYSVQVVQWQWVRMVCWVEALALLKGGKFGHGFCCRRVCGKAASIGMAGSNAYGVLRIDGEDFVALVSRTSISAAIGGTASNLSGGNFANGAVTAAMQHLFNAEASSSEKKIRAHDPNGGAYEVDVPVDVRNAMSNALGTDVSGITVVANSKWANF